MDPVREAERILRREGRDRTPPRVLVSVVALLAALALAWATGPSPSPRRNVPAVLRAGDTAQWCGPAIAEVHGAAWAATRAPRELRLPAAGRVRILDEADAVFTADQVTVALTPAMPCTPG